MSDEYDDDFDGESEESEQEGSPSQETDWKAKWESENKKNRQLRTKLRRAEIGTKYGAEIVELIPEELPLKKWDEYAGKLTEKLKPEPAEGDKAAESEQEDAGEAEPSEDEKQLAAAAQSPAATTEGTQRVSYEQYREMVTDPAQHRRAMELRAAGLVDD